MAINPLSSALTGANLPDPAPVSKPPAPQQPPSLDQLQASEAAILDPMLIDPASAQQQAGEDPLLGSFSSMTGGTGDPLLDDLNAMDDASASGGDAANPVSAEDASLNQQLTSFFMQQATGFYTASQQMDGIDPGSLPSGALGNTTA